MLLHSLSEFSSVIFPALESSGARRILEIGSEAGTFTRELCTWAGAHGGSVTAIEPLPRDEHRQLERDHGLELIVGKSPAALDGLLHDVGWPCARRDQYYEPNDVPEEHRQPFSYDGGVEPGEPGLVLGGGFRGQDAFAYAKHEGGPGNGVLTAVEDLLAELPELELLRIPCIFGLGLLFRSDVSWAARVREIVGPLHQNALLARLERNRIELFLRLIDPHRFNTQQDQVGSDLIAAQQREIAALTAEVSRLRLDAAQKDRELRVAPAS
jgi:hypothetical protein